MCLAPQKSAFRSSVDIVRRKGTLCCVALPTGCFDCPIADIVLKRITIRGSIVGNRQDLKEALDFAGRGLVGSTYSTVPFSKIADAVTMLRQGRYEGRLVIEIAADGHICED